MTGPEAQARLSGTWTVVFVRNASIPPVAVPELVFERERLAGFAGCNRFDAKLAYGADGALTLGEASTTRKSCGSAATAVEAQVLRALKLINAVTFESDDRIALTAFGTEMLIAERQD